MLEALLLGCSMVIALVVLPCPEDACRLHGPTLLGTKNAFHHDASPHIESPTVVTDPIIIWDFIDAIAFLVYRYVAHTTKNNEIFVLVVSIVADSALSVLLNNEATFMRAQRIVPVDIHAVCSQLIIVTHCKFLQNSFVIKIIFLLLP